MKDTAHPTYMVLNSHQQDQELEISSIFFKYFSDIVPSRGYTSKKGKVRTGRRKKEKERKKKKKESKREEEMEKKVRNN